MKNIERINWEINLHLDFETDEVSDWYHTFWELYKHRIHLFIALCKMANNTTGDKGFEQPIRSKIHKDWLNVWEDWGMFLLLLDTDYWQISYHIDKKYWDKCSFAKTELQAKEEWDWHTSDDVLERLLKI